MTIDGIITKAVAGKYTVRTAGGVFECTARGLFRNVGIKPLVGDAVRLGSVDGAAGVAVVETVMPRRNQSIRPPCANIDQAIITMTPTQPQFNPGLLDRFLALSMHCGIPSIICINKSDLLKPGDARAFEPYVQAGLDVVHTSTTLGTGIATLRAAMRGKLNMFAGPSGVGKSSIINALNPEFRLQTGQISRKLKAGKHTTRHTEIFALGAHPDDGYCLDTPGFSALDMAEIEKTALARLFVEFAPLVDGCRFANCLHITEADCAVKAAVGVRIHPLRYGSYCKLLELCR